MSKTKPGALRRFWRFLRTPSVRWSLLTLLIVGFFGGLAFWGVFTTTLAVTNTLAFCSTNCHEMETVTNEYKQSIHYSNRSGVRAGCPDCHVPHSLGPKLYAKMRASKEIWGKLTGVIDTPEKFEAKRMELATNQWEIMASTNSHGREGRRQDLHRLPQGHSSSSAEGISGSRRRVAAGNCRAASRVRIRVRPLDRLTRVACDAIT
jgi:cytochrome c-type protein NapC